MSRDPDADRFEAAEARLLAWGKSCMDTSGRLGVPGVSSMAQMTEHVRRQSREHAKAKRKAVRKKIRELRVENKARVDEGKPATPIDPKLIAQELGFADFELTVKGNPTTKNVAPRALFKTSDLQTEQIIRKLPKWAQKVVFRSYRFRQRDKQAADELRMRPGEYAQRRRAAVEMIADALERSQQSTTVRRRP